MSSKSKGNNTNLFKKKTINAKGLEIGVYTNSLEDEFISLTDIAKYQNIDDPRFVVRSWMRNRDTLEFLGIWETLYNPNFKRTEFDTFRNEAGRHAFTMSPEKWIDHTGAIGMISKRGRHDGGTYAHIDIAMSFATWISPEFQLYVMKDYRRLKTEEASRHSLDWNLRREIAKLNYRIQTDAIQENLLPPDLTEEQTAKVYADEADLLNVALFGLTAKEWAMKNPKKSKIGYIRDFATLEQLLVLSNLESYNAILIEQGKTQKERLILLREMANTQLKTLSSPDIKLIN